MNNQKIEIYQSENGQHYVDVRFESETLWLSQNQMAQLFDKNIRTINEHIKNILSEQELIADDSTIRKFRIVQKETVVVNFATTVKEQSQ